MSSIEENSLNEQSAGSPPPGEPVFLVIGKLRKPHGVRGEISMEVLTDFPERLKSGSTVFIGSAHRAALIASLRWHNELLLLSFQGYADPDRVGELRNQYVYIRSDQLGSLPDDEYYHHQILGLQVISDSGQALGIVTSILETGSNDVLVVESPTGTEILLPVIDEVILKIDLVAGTIHAHLLPGLLP
jgi:16S rRNA processing protein RimM